jgi:hydroxylamine reductase (hybrid-cluster protein)
MENELDKMTAVEWLWEQIDNAIPYQNIKTSQVFSELLEQALQMDKEQKKDAWEDGMRSDHGFFGTFEQYYNETYGGNNGE